MYLQGGPLTTLKALAGSIDQGMEGEGDQTRVKDYVTNALVEVGATPQFCEVRLYLFHPFVTNDSIFLLLAS